MATNTPIRDDAASAATERTPPAAAPGDVAPPATEFGSLAAQASDNTLAINPLVGLNPGDIARAAGSLLKAIGKAPVKAAGHYGRYLQQLGKVVVGRSGLAPEPKDRRFADPAWQGNPFYRALMQGHLATQKELGALIDDSGLGKTDQGRARFFASLVTDALAPSNFVLGNPAALRKVLDTGGANLVRGVRNLVHDMRHNHGLPQQVDRTPFKLGENIAASPGQVVHRDSMFELLQYTPSTPQVHARPLVMSPPQVNK